MLLSDLIVVDDSSANRIESIDPDRLDFLQGAVREAMKNVIDPNQLLLEAKVKLNSQDSKFN